MFFQVVDNVIIGDAQSLPRMFVKDDVQYPVVEMFNKGHDITYLGWYEQNIIKPTLSEGQRITGYTHAINGSQVDSTAAIKSETPAERKSRKEAQIDSIPEALALRFEAIEEALGMTKGQLTTNAKAKVK